MLSYFFEIGTHRWRPKLRHVLDNLRGNIFPARHIARYLIGHLNKMLLAVIKGHVTPPQLEHWRDEFRQPSPCIQDSWSPNLNCR